MTSNASAKNSAFKAHGLTRVRASGRLLYTDFTGPWNRELVMLWAQPVTAVANELAAGGVYATIVVVHGSMMCTPDAMVELTRAAKLTFTQFPCIAIAIVAGPEVEGRTLMKTQFENMSKGRGPLAYVHTLAQAEAFAHEQLRLRAASGAPMGPEARIGLISGNGSAGRGKS